MVAFRSRFSGYYWRLMTAGASDRLLAREARSAYDPVVSTAHFRS